MMQVYPAHAPLSSRLDTEQRHAAAVLRLASLPDKRRESFDRAIEAILTQREMSSGGKLVALTIAHMNRINPYRVSLAQLRRRTGYSDKTLIRHLRALEAAGVLKVTRSQGTTPSRYAVMTPEPFSA